MKRVEYFHYQRNRRDGSYVHTREFSRAFAGLCAERGIAFEVVAPALVPDAQSVADQARETWFRKLRHRLARWYLRDFLIWARQLRLAKAERQRLRTTRPDIVLTRFDDNTLSILWACRAEGIPVVLEINGPDRDEFDDVYRQLPFFRQRFSNRHALSLARGAFTVSEAISTPIRAYAPADKPVVTIPNGVDVTRFDPAEDGRPARRQYGIADDAVVLGFVGSFAPWHGLDMLVDAFEVLLAEGLPVHLMLVGQTNPKWQALVDRVRAPALAGRVTLTGFAAPEHIPALVAAMDVTVIPNAAYYCSPLKLFEYMAMARPVVAADTAPVAEIVRNGLEASLFSVGDLTAMTHALRVLAIDADLRQRLGAAARKRAVTALTWRHNAEQVFDLLATVLGEDPRT